LIAAFVVALLALGTVTSIASSAPPSSGASDSTKGTSRGPLSTPGGTFQSQSRIDAEATAAGTRGSFSVRIVTLSGEALAVSGDVTCLNAVGHSSSLLGRVTSQTGGFGPYPPGSLVNSQIIVGTDDNGDSATDPPDAIGVYFVPRNVTVTLCAFYDIPTLPQQQSNITVHDGI
jgi:hypothetical protein